MTALRTAVIIDYQNVHLTGRDLFQASKVTHESLVHPLHYANQLVQIRNSRQRPSHPAAILSKVLVYRGLPAVVHDPKPYARNLAQMSEWEKDPRVRVFHRPLKYKYQRTAQGQRSTDSSGKYIVIGKSEKGIDVLCALALVREARDPMLDLVILASQDTDLEPALDEVLALKMARVETASWYEPTNYASREIRPTTGRIWNTRLNASAFANSTDLNTY